jgi:type VI secretion system protein ImpA
MPLADFDTLLRPIPGDNPAGNASHFALTLSPALRELRREELQDEFTDATRPAVLKKADWTEVARQCEASLCEKAKDLRTACHLVEAWTRREGLAGLAQGLELLTQLVESCWDRLTPLEGDDPVESRGVPLANLLDDPDRGVCFPSLLRTLPLLGEPESALSYIAWTRLRSASSQDDLARLTSLRDNTATEVFRQQHQSAQQALASLQRLCSNLDERMGEGAPGLLNLRSALTDLTGLLADELKQLGVAAPAAVATSTEAASIYLSDDAPQHDPARDHLYALLDTTAERLRAMEPHSPVPYLIKRAVRLGRLPFPLLMEQVIREPSALSELNREFGIAVPDGPAVLAR